MMNVVFKIPVIVEQHENGFVRYFCQQCAVPTEPIKHSSHVVHAACGFVLSKNPVRFEGPVRMDGREMARYWCEQCEGWTDWCAIPRGPGGAVEHACGPSSANARKSVSEGNAVAPIVQERCNSGMIADAEMLLMMVEKRESTVSELRVLCQQVFPIIEQMRRVAAVEQLAQQNLENPPPVS